MAVGIYLMFNGNCEEAINFYAAATGGSIDFLQRFGDSPMPTAESRQQKVMHASITIAGSTILCSDTDGTRDVTFGDNFSISINFDSVNDIDTMFAALSAGGTVTMPLQDTFWNARFGMCTDKFGVNWMFNYDYPQENSATKTV
jgi:PhnB protein